jgi:hypothetical protein
MPLGPTGRHAGRGRHGHAQGHRRCHPRRGGEAGFIPGAGPGRTPDAPGVPDAPALATGRGLRTRRALAVSRLALPPDDADRLGGSRIGADRHRCRRYRALHPRGRGIAGHGGLRERCAVAPRDGPRRGLEAVDRDLRGVLRTPPAALAQCRHGVAPVWSARRHRARRRRLAQPGAAGRPRPRLRQGRCRLRAGLGGRRRTVRAGPGSGGPGHEFGARVIAEGVDDEADLDALWALGFDGATGVAATRQHGTAGAGSVQAMSPA